MVSGASGYSNSRGYSISWSVNFDDVTNVLTVQADGQALEAELVVTLSNGQTRAFDLLPILNKGPQTFTNTRLRIVLGPNGAGWPTIQERWTPPN